MPRRIHSWPTIPRNAGKLFRQAEREAQEGKRDAAIADYRAAIQLAPNKTLYHLRLGRVLDSKNDLNAALQEYSTAHQLAPNDQVADIMYRGLVEELKDPQVTALNLGGTSAAEMTEPIPVYHPNPEYTEEARRAKVQGTIILAVLVSADGRVTDVHLRLGLGHGMIENAVKVVRTWRFKPAMLNGNSVPTRALVEIGYTAYDTFNPELGRF